VLWADHYSYKFRAAGPIAPKKTSIKTLLGDKDDFNKDYFSAHWVAMGWERVCVLASQRFARRGMFR
jgi:hypothetical protein